MAGQKLPKNGQMNDGNKWKIIETYWHDHSLESSGGALSDSTIRFSSYFFLKKKQSSRIKRAWS
jgi:hypothetical protein